MADEKNQDTNLAEEESEPILLVQRIRNLLQEPKIKAKKSNKPINHPAEDWQKFCIVCGLPRQEPDPTGLTCNQPNCIIRLGTEYKNSIEERIDKFKSVLREKLCDIAVRIGLNLEQLPKDTEEICETISSEIKKIVLAVKDLEEKQKTE